MSPTYNEGDWLLVRWFPTPATNNPEEKLEKKLVDRVVVVEREERPGILLVKRVRRVENGQFWVEGDNPASTDSRTWGWIPHNEIVGVALFRYRKNRAGK